MDKEIKGEKEKPLLKGRFSTQQKYFKSRSEQIKPPSPDFSWAFDRAGATKKSRADCLEKQQTLSADGEISN